MTAATDEIARQITVKSIRWVSAAASPGDSLTLVESSTGNTSYVIWDDVAEGANYVTVDLHNMFFQHGLRISVIDSGTLWVYLSRDRV